MSYYDRRRQFEEDFGVRPKPWWLSSSGIHFDGWIQSQSAPESVRKWVLILLEAAEAKTHRGLK